MTAATWVLAIATAAIALEGGTAVWKYLRIRPGRTRGEIDGIKNQLALLRHAMWMDVTTSGQGQRPQIDERIRNLLSSDGWQPDMEYVQTFGYFDLHRIMGHGDSQ